MQELAWRIQNIGSLRFIQSGNNMIALICKKTCWIKKISRRKIAFLSNLITETCHLLAVWNSFCGKRCILTIMQKLVKYTR